MTEPSNTGSQDSTGPASSRSDSGRQRDAAGDSWEQRAAGAASEIQRWLIRTSARTMRDEIGGQVKGQVKKAFRGSDSEPGDSWATATTEPPHAAGEAPECAWCPVCRAARRISQARSSTDTRGGPRLADAADVMAAAVRDALSGIDSILSYRPGEAGAPGAARESGSSGSRAGSHSAPRPEPDAADAQPADEPAAADAQPAAAAPPAAEAPPADAEAPPAPPETPSAAGATPGAEPPAAGTGGDPHERA